MTRKRKPYKTYPKEFKLEAVRLMRESDRPASEIAIGKPSLPKSSLRRRSSLFHRVGFV